VAAGIRRIEAVTGPRAYARVRDIQDRLERLATELRVPTSELSRRVQTLVSEKAVLEERLAAQHGRDAQEVIDGVVREAEELPGGGRLASGSVDLPPGADVAAFGDLLRDRIESGAAIVHVRTGDEDRGAFIAVVTDDWIRRGLKAGDLVGVASRATGSGGGGRPHLARGGVGNGDQVSEAIAAAVRTARETAAPAESS
jgi:alanyl-tRNA synthetase